MVVFRWNENDVGVDNEIVEDKDCVDVDFLSFLVVEFENFFGKVKIFFKGI